MAVSSRKLIRTGQRRDMFDGIGQYQYDKTTMRPKDTTWRKVKSDVDIPKILSVFLNNNGKLKRNSYILRRSENKPLSTVITDLRQLFTVQTDPADIWKLTDLNGKAVASANELYMRDASSFVLSKQQTSTTTATVPGKSLSFNGVIQGRLKSAAGVKNTRKLPAPGWMYGKSNLRLKSGIKTKTAAVAAKPHAQVAQKTEVPKEPEAEEPQIDPKVISQEIVQRHLKRVAEEKELAAKANIRDPKAVRTKPQIKPKEPQSVEADKSTLSDGPNTEEKVAEVAAKADEKKINFDINTFLEGNWAEAEKHLEELLRSETSEDLWVDVESTAKPKGLSRLNRRLEKAKKPAESKSDFGDEFFNQFGKPPVVVQRTDTHKIIEGDPFDQPVDLNRSGSAVRNWVVPLVTPQSTKVVTSTKPKGRIGRLIQAKSEANKSIEYSNTEDITTTNDNNVAETKSPVEVLSKPIEDVTTVEPIESKSYEILQRDDVKDFTRDVKESDTVSNQTFTVADGTASTVSSPFEAIGKDDIPVGPIPLPTKSPRDPVEPSPSD